MIQSMPLLLLLRSALPDLLTLHYITLPEPEPFFSSYSRALSNSYVRDSLASSSSSLRFRRFQLLDANCLPRLFLFIAFFSSFFFFQFSFWCGPCASKFTSTVFAPYRIIMGLRKGGKEGWMGYNMINRLRNGRA